MDVNRLSDTRQADFHERGYVIIKGLFSTEVLEAVRGAMSDLVDREAARLMAAGLITDPRASDSFGTRIMNLYADCPDEARSLFRPELHLPGLYPLFFHPGLLDLVDLLLGPELRLYPNYSARPKLPDNPRTLVLWHQDGGYTGGDAGILRMVNVWTALVPATVENGCMEFIPGTHRLGVVPHEAREYYLEIAEEYLAPRRDQAVAIETEPGDAVLFHNLLFHRGLPNRSNSVRWSLDWRYQDATQPTQRAENGHLARSSANSQAVVSGAEQWANLSFS
jgi:ectoine hydroxylase-related dioxygenase (phytanoyl-CoA dioxygenase family)